MTTHYRLCAAVLLCAVCLFGASTSGQTTLAAAVQRGGDYLGFVEQFNRYYTEPNWLPSRTLYVSRSGSATSVNSSSASNPLSVDAVLGVVQAGDLVIFQRDALPYTDFNYRLWAEHSATADNPIVFYGERNDDGSLGVQLQCAQGSSNHTSSCFNVESAHYIAIDGFEMIGGYYGVRAVGSAFAPAGNQFGLALLNNDGHDQYKDPFFTGQSSWAVVEGNVAHGAGDGDGHGIYLSNGGDWNIVRFNELFDNSNAGFQINADPYYTCQGEGIGLDDPLCDGAAELGLGQGVSEYMLLEGNYFHDDEVGVNFTSMRNSVVRKNIIGPALRHNTSFWQETDNPELGSHSNLIEDNLFVGNNRRHVLQFINYSDRNTVRGNILLGLSSDGQSANTSTVLIEMDPTTASTQEEMDGNYYLPGQFDGYTPNETEILLSDFSPSWFLDAPFPGRGEAANWTPSENAPAAQFGGWQPLTQTSVATAPVSSVALATDKPPPVQLENVGEVTLTASTLSTDGDVEYQFFARDPAGTWFLMRDYAGDNTLNLGQPSSAGTWVLLVHARNEGSDAEYEAQAWMYYDVVPPPLSLVNLTVDKPPPVRLATVGDVAFTASAIDASSSVEYQFFARDPAGNWLLARDYSNNDTFNAGEPYASGTWVMLVHARHQGSEAEFEAQSWMYYEVTP